MEQKGLDEIEESFLGEEIIEDEVSFMTENNAKKTAMQKKKASVKKTEKPKILTAEEIEDVIITPADAAKSEVKVEEVKVEDVKITPVVETKVEKSRPISASASSSSSSKPRVEPWGKDPAEANGSNAWAILSGVLVVLLLISVFTSGFSFGTTTGSSTDSISLSEAEDIVQEYVNTNLLPEPFTAGLVSSEDSGDLYRVTLTVNGQEIDSYITKDGNLFFPQGLELETENVIEEEESNTETSETEYVEVDRVDVSTDDDAIKGEWNAPVTIIEFSDYECPFCGKFYSETLPLIQENYIDTGVVRLIFRDFPLEFHSEAEGAAIAAECAGEQGNYYFMHDRLYENQEKLSEEYYLQLADEFLLDIDEFTVCLASEEMANEVAKDLADGQSYGVSGTPGFFVNGELISGAQPYEAFVAAIERALAEIEHNSGMEEEVVEVEVIEEEVIEEVAEEIIEETEEVAETGDTSSFDVVAKKWRFDPSTITVSAGDNVQLNIMPEGIDEFTFSIEAFGVEEVISGDTLISFTASSTGTFEYSCSSCESWRGMTGELVVE
ncbi:thioredoxin domain-containing protein [archaeon]|jgi:protein-disulfide isomerase/plastocyanin|nr:thioredoxin domain-containing protein [archaeon]MBT6762088.1 thioredoxin domain-containing protein [archaeon]